MIAAVQRTLFIESECFVSRTLAEIDRDDGALFAAIQDPCGKGRTPATFELLAPNLVKDEIPGEHDLLYPEWPSRAWRKTRFLKRFPRSRGSSLGHAAVCKTRRAGNSSPPRHFPAN